MPLTTFRQFHHLAGTAPDTTPREFDLYPPAMRIDIAVFTNDALVSFSPDGIFFSTERRFPAGMIASLDGVVRKLRIRNRVVAAPADYDISGFYSPEEVVGTPFVPVTVGGSPA